MVFTIGHSHHSLTRFVSLLKQHGVEEIIDVRSVPISRFVPHFNHRELEIGLAESFVRYLYLGRELGGRPSDPVFYDELGQVVYDRLAQSVPFLEGISMVMDRDLTSALALMCAEENPARCHRHLIVSRVLASRRVSVEHIRADGRLETFADIERELRKVEIESGQTELFGR